MGKKIFILIVVLMSISLIGIISVQVYWIKDAVKNKQQQFDNNIKIALARTSERIKEREYADFFQNNQEFLKDKKFVSKAKITTYLFQQIDTTNKRKFTFGTTVLGESIKMPADFIDNDSIVIKRYSGKQDFYFSQIMKSNNDFTPFVKESRVSQFKTYPKFNKQLIEDMLQERKKYSL
ncbi:hypothetical protein PG910_03770 [Tenacibaculum dicentrarchi]|nr:hypothetical protein [Tenacibaculum dicentrarchi]WBX69502.1 hypothetical protein PG910_03770 [Tenacibaculum dicentrarchi]